MVSLYQSVIYHLRNVKWMLLLFLIFFLDVKMPVKIAVLVILLLLNYKLFLQKKIYHQKFTWFYATMILIAFINLIINISSISANQFIATSVGILFWCMCLGASLLNISFVLKTETHKLHTTITFFFILNIAVTVFQLLWIMWDAGSINPYTYQGMRQKYFIGTGDLLTGITFDVSSTNAILNAFGIVYFLSRNKMFLALICMTTMLLTGSNFTNILVTLVLLFLFAFYSTKDQKSVIVVCLLFVIIFAVQVSPQNHTYVTEAYKKFACIINKKYPTQTDIPLLEKPDSILTTEEKRQKIAMLYIDSLKKVRIAQKYIAADPITFVPTYSKLTIPKPNIHTEPFQRRRDTSLFQKKLQDFAVRNIPSFDTNFKHTKQRRMPGKLFAFKQTFQYLRSLPSKILFGSGTGNFSSKLAFRTTGLQMAGSYPGKLAYIHPDFLTNHLRLYLDYSSKDIELHSLINTPNSVYDQLIAEYGLVGMLAFIIFYIAFFLKKVRKLTYGTPLLLLLAGAFATDYWYEQLSIVIVFELLMLVNLKEAGQI